MSGKLPDTVLKRLTDPREGLFPTSKEISLDCDCPDGAYLCKHVAAVMYGIGNRLDSQPELFFNLRGVRQQDLVAESVSGQNVDQALGLTDSDDGDVMNAGGLESIFGIDLSTSEPPAKKKVTARKKAAPKKK